MWLEVWDEEIGSRRACGVGVAGIRAEAVWG